jgi:PleD family two-component response regulator
LGPKELYPPPLVTRVKPDPDYQEVTHPIDQAQSVPADIPNPPDADTDKSATCNVKQALIVDDNAINRRLLSAWMKRHKAPFQAAKDGLEALEMYKEEEGRFDVILMVS